MHLSVKTVAIMSYILVLPSCGGSASPQTGSTAAQSFQSRIEIFNNQSERLRSLAPTAAMPTQGKATYRGSIGVSGNQNFVQPEAVGNLLLDVDFASATMSGTLSGFVSPAGTRSAPPMTLSNGLIAGKQIIADVSGGSPLAPAGENISGSIQGSFLGMNASAVAGTLVGTGASGSLYGKFGAER